MFNFISYRVSMFYMLLFIGFFQHRRTNKVVSILALLWVYISTGAIEYYTFVIQDLTQFNPILMYAEMMFYFIPILLIGKYRDGRGTFVAVTAVDVMIMGNVTAQFIYLQKQSIFLAIGAKIIIHTALLVALIILMRETFWAYAARSKKNWWEMTAIAGLLFISVSQLINWPINIRMTPLVIMPVVTILILMSLFCIIMMNLLRAHNQEDRVRQDRDMMESYARHVRRETELMIEKERDAAVMRHDLRHHNNLILSYLNAGEYDKIEELLIQNNNRLEQTKGYRYCKNVAINGLLSRFEFSCEKRGVQFVCTANVADFGQDDMIEFEYAAALSNLVENAVEATFRQDPTEERFVRVTINSEHGRMGTKIENTYSEAAIHMDETGVLTSEKKESGHGLGLHSVNSFVEKYNGIFSQDFGKDLAVTRLVFNMPDQA